MVVEGPEDTYKVVRTLMGATNPAEAAPGTIRGDLAIETGENLVHGSDCPGVGGAGDRPVLPRPGLTSWPGGLAPRPRTGTPVDQGIEVHAGVALPGATLCPPPDSRSLKTDAALLTNRDDGTGTSSGTPVWSSALGTSRPNIDGGVHL